MTGRTRITMLTADGSRGASTRYRVLAYRPALEAAGFVTEVRFPIRGPGGGLTRPAWRAADLLRDLVSPARERILFVHRKTYPPALAGWLERSTRSIVYDMDDAIDLPPPSRTLSSAAERRYRRNFVATVESADLVLCGNTELAKRLPHDRFQILPTPVDTVRFAPQRGKGPPGGKTLGWVGHSDNLRYLEALAEPLREIGRRHPGVRLIVVADKPPRLPGIEVEFRRWTLETEVSCFSGVGVGLMPLEDTPWTRGKCSFKALQYMALGIPAVASPVGMNCEVIRHGATGYLPASDGEWVEVVDRLLSDTGLSAEIGMAGRRVVESDYSLQSMEKRLLAALDPLVSKEPPGAAGDEE